MMLQRNILFYLFFWNIYGSTKLSLLFNIYEDDVNAVLCGPVLSMDKQLNLFFGAGIKLHYKINDNFRFVYGLSSSNFNNICGYTGMYMYTNKFFFQLLLGHDVKGFKIFVSIGGLIGDDELFLEHGVNLYKNKINDNVFLRKKVESNNILPVSPNIVGSAELFLKTFSEFEEPISIMTDFERNLLPVGDEFNHFNDDPIVSFAEPLNKDLPFVNLDKFSQTDSDLIGDVVVKLSSVDTFNSYEISNSNHPESIYERGSFSSLYASLQTPLSFFAFQQPILLMKDAGVQSRKFFDIGVQTELNIVNGYDNLNDIQVLNITYPQDTFNPYFGLDMSRSSTSFEFFQSTTESEKSEPSSDGGFIPRQLGSNTTMQNQENYVLQQQIDQTQFHNYVSNHEPYVEIPLGPNTTIQPHNIISNNGQNNANKFVPSNLQPVLQVVSSEPVLERDENDGLIQSGVIFSEITEFQNNGPNIVSTNLGSQGPIQNVPLNENQVPLQIRIDNTQPHNGISNNEPYEPYVEIPLGPNTTIQPHNIISNNGQNNANKFVSANLKTFVDVNSSQMVSSEPLLQYALKREVNDGPRQQRFNVQPHHNINNNAQNNIDRKKIYLEVDLRNNLNDLINNAALRSFQIFVKHQGVHCPVVVCQEKFYIANFITENNVIFIPIKVSDILNNSLELNLTLNIAVTGKDLFWTYFYTQHNPDRSDNLFYPTVTLEDQRSVPYRFMIYNSNFSFLMDTDCNHYFLHDVENLNQLAFANVSPSTFFNIKKFASFSNNKTVGNTPYNIHTQNESFITSVGTRYDELRNEIKELKTSLNSLISNQTNNMESRFEGEDNEKDELVREIKELKTSLNSLISNQTNNMESRFEGEDNEKDELIREIKELKTSLNSLISNQTNNMESRFEGEDNEKDELIREINEQKKKINSLVELLGESQELLNLREERDRDRVLLEEEEERRRIILIEKEARRLGESQELLNLREERDRDRVLLEEEERRRIILIEKEARRLGESQELLNLGEERGRDRVLLEEEEREKFLKSEALAKILLEEEEARKLLLKEESVATKATILEKNNCQPEAYLNYAFEQNFSSYPKNKECQISNQGELYGNIYNYMVWKMKQSILALLDKTLHPIMKNAEKDIKDMFMKLMRSKTKIAFQLRESYILKLTDRYFKQKSIFKNKNIIKEACSEKNTDQFYDLYLTLMSENSTFDNHLIGFIAYFHGLSGPIKKDIYEEIFNAVDTLIAKLIPKNKIEKLGIDKYLVMDLDSSKHEKNKLPFIYSYKDKNKSQKIYACKSEIDKAIKSYIKSIQYKINYIHNNNLFSPNNPDKSNLIVNKDLSECLSEKISFFKVAKIFHYLMQCFVNDSKDRFNLEDVKCIEKSIPKIQKFAHCISQIKSVFVKKD